MPPKGSHTHKFKRYKYKTGASVFFCTLDNCNFKIGVEFSLGKSNICWRCGKTFEMNSYAIRLARPHCPECHQTKDSKDAPNISLSESDISNLANSIMVSEYKDRRSVPRLDPNESIESLKAKLNSDQESDSELVPVKYKEIPIEDDDDLL